MTQFSALLQPGKIGTLQLKNRIIMSAMGTALADESGRVTDRMVTYYAARAKGGAGLVTPQFAAVSRDSAFAYTLPLFDDSRIADWRRIADAVHEAGSKFSIQLMHVGLILLYSGILPEGASILVPSMASWMGPDRPYRELTEKDIDRYVNDFVAAAVRAKAAGADVIELHACHGCLVSSFLSPLINRRQDQYGGNVENRTRFARLIVEGIKREVGKEFPLSVRINCSDGIDGGLTVEEAAQQARILEAAGADAISVSGGLEFWSTLSVPSYPYPEGPMVLMAEKIKKSVKVPVIVAGKVNAELADKVISEGKVDFIAMGRPLLADPELPNKIREGRVDDLRRCIYCNNCLKSATDAAAGPMSCTVNPFVAREAKYPLKPAAKPKKVMVVGGGLAGMEMAMYLTERGHTVALYEKENELGGQWNIACALPGKKGYAALTDYLKRWLKKNGVEIHLGTAVTREMVIQEEAGRCCCRHRGPSRGTQRSWHQPASCDPGTRLHRRQGAGQGEDSGGGGALHRHGGGYLAEGAGPRRRYCHPRRPGRERHQAGGVHLQDPGGPDCGAEHPHVPEFDGSGDHRQSRGHPHEEPFLPHTGRHGDPLCGYAFREPAGQGTGRVGHRSPYGGRLREAAGRG